MTVSEFVQSVILVCCLLATGIVVPIGLVAVSAPGSDGARIAEAGPVFVFEPLR